MFIACPLYAQRNSKMGVLQHLPLRSIWSYAISTHMTRDKEKCKASRKVQGKGGKQLGFIGGRCSSKFVARNM